MAAIPKSKWKWYGNAGHYICGQWCRFHLCTEIGPYLVSTVGEYWPDRIVREIHARIYDPEWHAKHNILQGDAYDNAYMKRFGYEQIGMDRTFETMTFRWGSHCDTPECGCGLPLIDGSELDFRSYNHAKDATEGHYKACLRAARGKLEEKGR